MKRLLITMMMLTLIALCSTGAQAVSYELFESQWNIDGVVTSSVDGPFSSISWGTSLSGAGSHDVLLFVDPEIDEAINTFFNEYGSANGVPVAGQSWEIDEPGYVFGDIYDNFVAGSLDNANAVPAGSEEDVSMALGYTFVLNPGDIADIRFDLSPTVPTAGFYLSLTDPDSQASLYFSGDLDIRTGNPVIPEPSTFVLMGSAVAGLLFYARRRQQH
ncbi:MAG: PEP-CTERM sorting domain-containing protein [Nitrospirales bacterium]|nr:PEP-CTERM sorting domain-containing protein [Nitrospirales bacterium]